jgi:hypothetical protein
MATHNMGTAPLVLKAGDFPISPREADRALARLLLQNLLDNPLAVPPADRPRLLKMFGRLCGEAF